MNKSELGSKTAKGGFANEKAICEKFNKWKEDKEVKEWLKVMGYEIEKIDSVKAIHIPIRMREKNKRANPLGKVPDDVWKFPRACSTFKERVDNHMPEELLGLIIKASSKENDLVLDPFGGTGTTAAAAKKLKRNFITIEISKEYHKAILNRLNLTKEQQEPHSKISETQYQKTLFTENLV